MVLNKSSNKIMLQWGEYTTTISKTWKTIIMSVSFRNASYVITDSFHGTLFSILFNIPFTSIVNPQNTDSRVTNFLKRIGMEKNALPFDAMDVAVNEINNNLEEIERFRDNSHEILKKFLNE